LEKDFSVATKAYVDTGGAHFENAATDVTAATTVSASWSGDYVGMFVVKRDDAVYNTITANDSNSLTLTSNYLGKTTTAAASAGDGYAIFKHIYEVDSAVQSVISVMCEDDRLGKATDKYINEHDADFQEEGAPVAWRRLGSNSANVTQIQLYPALIDDVYLLRVHARIKVESLTDSTKPLLDSTLINSFAEVELMKRKKLLDPNAVTDSMIEASMANAANQFNYAIEDERHNRTDEPYVLDEMFKEHNRLVTHDPWDA
jgi:hypothetical protein